VVGSDIIVTDVTDSKVGDFVFSKGNAVWGKVKTIAGSDVLITGVKDVIAPISITYDNLYTLKTASKLTVGQVYRISDYKTTYRQAETNIAMEGEVEPLFVTAVTTNSLHIKAKSETYPLHEIWYNIENIQEIAYGATKGFIYRRKDEKNNDIGFDFMNVKFRRYQVTGNAWGLGSPYSK
jgi:hypothetical protein